MLYLIGLGLNEKGLSIEGFEAIKKCKKIYLESYTVDFPYKIKKLEKIIEEKILRLERNEVESERLVKEAKKQNIALLVYGSPLFATTHVSLLMDCEKAKIKAKIIYSASIFDAIAETGLQLYKFGKISSMPLWKDNFEPDSFMDIIKENQSINSHSLILIDIGLEFKNALDELEKSANRKKINMEKILVCSNLGTPKSKIHYETIEKLKNKKVSLPYCFIIPGKMHFLEKEALERFQ